MPWTERPKPPAVTGSGALRLGTAEHAVTYALSANPAHLRRGPKGIRGSITAESEVAAEAFRYGDGYLVLAEGAEFKVKVLAHSTGSPTAYIELWKT